MQTREHADKSLLFFENLVEIAKKIFFITKLILADVPSCSELPCYVKNKKTKKRTRRKTQCLCMQHDKNVQFAAMKNVQIMHNSLFGSLYFPRNCAVFDCIH